MCDRLGGNMFAEYVLLFFVFMLMLSFYIRFKNFFKAITFGAISGFFCMLLCGYFLQNIIRFNMFNIVISIITGAPGVLMLIILNRFLFS